MAATGEKPMAVDTAHRQPHRLSQAPAREGRRRGCRRLRPIRNRLKPPQTSPRKSPDNQSEPRGPHECAASGTRPSVQRTKVKISETPATKRKSSAPERIRTSDLRFRRPTASTRDLALESQVTGPRSPNNRQKFDSVALRKAIVRVCLSRNVAETLGRHTRRVPSWTASRYAEALSRCCATQRCSVSGATSAPLGQLIVPSSRSSSTRAK
jgi:hypothetical protein